MHGPFHICATKCCVVGYLSNALWELWDGSIGETPSVRVPDLQMNCSDLTGMKAYWDSGPHYNDVIMDAIASQITSLTIVYSIVYSDADQRKHQSSASHWPLCGEFTGDRWIPRTNGQLHGKCFHLMTSSWTMPSRRHALFYELNGWNYVNVVTFCDILNLKEQTIW